MDGGEAGFVGEDCCAAAVSQDANNVKATWADRRSVRDVRFWSLMALVTIPCHLAITKVHLDSCCVIPLQIADVGRCIESSSCNELSAHLDGRPGREGKVEIAQQENLEQ